MVNSKEKLESIFKVAPVGIGVVKRRILTEVNSRICEIVGYEREELIGSSSRILYPDQEEYELVGREKYRQIAEKGTGTVETKWKRKNGSIIDVLLSSTPIDQTNHSHGVTFAALDITDRKQAEAELIDREERFRLLYDNAPLPYQSLDENGCFIDVNPAWLKNLGYEREEVIGRPFSDILHPDWASDFQECFERFKFNRYVSDIQYKIRHKDGHHLHVSFEGRTSCHQDGSFKQTYCVFKDITEQIESEEKMMMLAGLLKTSPASITIHDFEGQILFANQLMYRIHGYLPDEIKDLNLRSLADTETNRKAPEIFQTIKDRGAASFEVWHIKKDGTRFPLKVSTKIIPWQGKKAILSIALDITDQKKAEEALIYAKALADESNRIKSEMLNNVTHELRTPLSTVIGFADQLLHGTETEHDELQKRYLEYIYQSGEKLLSIVNRMLDFANMEHNISGSVELQPVNIRTLVHDTASVLLANASKKNIQIITTVDHGLDTFIADKGKLESILFNLVENAIKFTDDSGTVTVRASSGTDDTVIFSIKDTGIGIEKERHENIFEAFTQVDGSMSRKYGGTGLGLALVRKLVEMHGGSIRVESEPGKGSNFIFEIPIEAI